MASSLVALVSFNFISPFVHNFLTILFNYPDKEYSIEIADKSLFINVKEQLTDFRAYADIISAGGNSFYFIDNYHYGVGFFDFETNESWHHEIIKNHEYQKVVSLMASQENDILVVTGETDNQLEGNKFIKLYSKTGEELFDINLDDHVLLLDIQLIESYEDHFDLLIPFQNNDQNNSYEYKKMQFTKSDNQWSHSTENYLNLSLPLSSMTTIDNHIKIGAVVSKPDIHYGYFGIVRYDSAWNLMWYTNIYDKSNPYDPIVPLQHVISEKNNEILTQHSLSNDTAVFCIIKSLNLETGAIKWTKKINIPADFTEFHTLDYNNDFIYMAGESHKEITKWPWKPNFHAGFVTKLDRSTGALISYKHFGNKSMDGHTRFSTFVQTDSSLQLIGVEEANNIFSFESADRKHFIWEIRKEDI